MKNITDNIEIQTDCSQITNSELAPYAKDLRPFVQSLQKQTKQELYNTNFSSIQLPFDEKYHKKIKSLALVKKKLNPDFVVIVGIGGSNLGTMAILESIHGKLHNQTQNKPQFFFAESTDTRYIQDIVTHIQLQKQKKVLLVVVSKSGTTTETIANAQILFDSLLQHQKKQSEFVVTITDENSALHTLSKKHSYSTLFIPKKVGGRFSVFSAVGLFVLSLAGIKTKNILNGAQDMIEKYTQTTVSQNPALQLAITQYLHFKNNKTIHDLFVFDSSFESIGKWYRQLYAESLGKEYNVLGERVLTGFTPTVSVGSTDLHSIGQLYLGGPKDKFTMFLSVATIRPPIKINKSKQFSSLIPLIQNKSLATLMDAIQIGVQIAYKKQHIPFVQIQIAQINEYTIGSLLQFYMCTVMYLGELLQVNTYDQPNVELYKIETKKLLENTK